MDGSDENCDRAARLSSRETMAASADKFDDHYLCALQAAAECAVVMRPAAKCLPESQRGHQGHAREELSPSTRAALRRAWAERVEPSIGLRSYAEMAELLKEDHEPWQELV